MRINKRVREQAAEVCQLAASNENFNSWYGGVADQLGLERDSDPVALALAAWSFAWEHAATLYDENIDAEAEALLRDGWSPRAGQWVATP